MNNNDDTGYEQIAFPLIQSKDQVRSFKRIIPVSIYDFYIVDEIKEPEKYLDLIHTLKSADQQDTVFIYLNTPGGNLYTTVQIMSAMISSKATVITCMEGQVCSAGTFIFLKGDTKIVNPNCTFMIHNYSQSTSGKGNEVVSQINYMGDYFNRLAVNIYNDFLTQGEINEVTKGRDLWMHSSDVVNRLKEYKHDYIYTGDDSDLTVSINTKLGGEDSGDKVKDKTKTPTPRIRKKTSKKSNS